MGSHHQMTPVNDGTQPEASFSGAGDTKVEGRAKSQEDEREERDIYAWSVGMMGCCCSMLLGTLPSRHLMGQLAHNSLRRT